ncbi:unnamed protein product [Blepharisma stoltei]|uniref:Uncharacterized protein n=1 Tax=Blepharisma stoltei TaxID=1481888 RepID=A0AAU9IWV6_9CILI|nr:unnamed protein product [Blepharisma stoltei]
MNTAFRRSSFFIFKQCRALITTPKVHTKTQFRSVAQFNQFKENLVKLSYKPLYNMSIYELLTAVSEDNEENELDEEDGM